MASAYSVTLSRSRGPRPALNRASSLVTASRKLRSSRMRARRTRGSVAPLSPNSRSNTARGLFSIGRGVVGVRTRSCSYRRSYIHHHTHRAARPTQAPVRSTAVASHQRGFAPRSGPSKRRPVDRLLRSVEYARLSRTFPLLWHDRPRPPRERGIHAGLGDRLAQAADL